MTYVLVGGISLVIGFVLGFLVFRNNKNKFQQIEDAIKK